MSWWWMSFADAERPKGQQFLGVLLIEADSIPDAVSLSHRLKLNPGGEIELSEFPEEELPPERFRYRLLSREEAMSL